MQSYVYWSIVISAATALCAVLAVGAHRADLTSYGGDPLGTMILFYVIAILAWLNSLVALGIAWGTGTHENAKNLFLVQFLAVPIATIVLNGVAFKTGPWFRDIGVSVRKYFNGSTGAYYLYDAITAKGADKTYRMLRGNTLYPISKTKKIKVIFEIASDDSWPYQRLQTEVIDAVANADRNYGEALFCGVVTVCHQLDAVQHLLGRGYDANRIRCDGWRDHSGAPSLAFVQYRNVFWALREAGAELGATDAQGTQVLSLLMLSIAGHGPRQAKGHYKMHALTEDDLLNALMMSPTHFNPNQQNVRGNTALHVAAGTSLPKLAKELLKRGADPNLRNQEGHTALHYAKSEQMKKLLVDHGAQLNSGP